MRSHDFKLLLCAGLAVLCGASPASAQSAAEIVATPRVSGLSPSPDGKLATFVRAVNVFDAAARPSDDDTSGGWRAEAQLWLLDLARGDARPLTAGKARPSAATWSPDARAVAFVRKVEGGPAIHVLPLAGGEAEIVSCKGPAPSDLRWSPDGASFFFAAEGEPSEAEREAAWRSGGVSRFEGQWRTTRVWRLPRAGGEAQAVTPEGEHVVAWEVSPDGRRLVVLTSPSSDPYRAMIELKARVVDLASATVTATLALDPRPMGRPRWSPDGRLVAVLRAEEGLSLMRSVRVWEPESGASWEAQPGRDMSLMDFVFAPDGKSLVLHEAYRTGTRLSRLSLERGRAGKLSELGFGARVIAPGAGLEWVLGGRALLVMSSTFAEPPAPTIFELGSRKVRTPYLVAPEVARWPTVTQELVRWTVPDEGVELEGLLMLPKATEAGRRPPLIVLPHGGPDWMTDGSYSGMTRYFAGRGYAVFRPNYRGGLAYGFDFYAANRGRFGDIELMDIESGVDALIADGRVDPDRLYYGGWSWGGYLSAWTLTHATRYLAHVVGAAINDTVLQYATSDVNHGEIARWEFKGDPWCDPEAFARPNPIRYVTAARAPTLILHGGEDERVHLTNSVVLYRALADLGVPVRFHVYPREPHGVQEPAHVVHMLETWAEWYDQHPGKR